MQCRACLKTDCENISQLDELKMMYFNFITNLCIHKDEMPQQLCENCTKDLMVCVEFKEKCITSNSILINAQTTNEDLKVTTDIKQEDVLNGLEQDVINYNIEIDKKEDTEVKDEYHLSLQTEDSFVYESDNKEKNTDDNAQLAVLKGNSKRNVSRARYQISKTSASYKKVPVFQKYDCGLCMEKVRKDKLADHVKSHEKNDSCGICSFHVKEWDAKLQHRISHLKKPNLICHLCLRIFQSPVTLECHYNIKHLGKNEDGVWCKECNKSYSSVRNLQRHMGLMHKSLETYECNDCSKVFPSKNAINYHNFKYHVKKKRLFCGDCDYTTELKSSLRKHHLRRHAAEKEFCKLCKALFANEDGLQRHKCKYSTESICPVCGIVFEVPVKMMRHLETHSDERKHKCDRCDAAFKSRGALRVHLSKHDGVRAHSCEYCPATFWAHSTLNKHRRVHTGEKPYVCKVCNKGFTANHNLKVHMRVHGVFNLIKKKGMGDPIDSLQEFNKSNPIDYT